MFCITNYTVSITEYAKSNDNQFNGSASTNKWNITYVQFFNIYKLISDFSDTARSAARLCRNTHDDLKDALSTNDVPFGGHVDITSNLWWQNRQNVWKFDPKAIFQLNEKIQ